MFLHLRSDTGKVCIESSLDLHKSYVLHESYVFLCGLLRLSLLASLRNS